MLKRSSGQAPRTAGNGRSNDGTQGHREGLNSTSEKGKGQKQKPRPGEGPGEERTKGGNKEAGTRELRPPGAQALGKQKPERGKAASKETT